MGYSTNSDVTFICAEPENEWAAQFVTSNQSVPGAGEWEADYQDVPVYDVKTEYQCRIITLSSGFYGLINPAKMDLPKSLLAVVYASTSCQNDPEDPIYVVAAKNVRTHDFSDQSEVVKPSYFLLDKKRAINWADDEDMPAFLKDIENVDDAIYRYGEALERQRKLAKEHLITQVWQRGRAYKDIIAKFNYEETPFLDNPGSEIYDAEAEIEYTNTDIAWLEDHEMPELLAWLDPDIKEIGYVDQFAKYAPKVTGLSTAEYVSALTEAKAGGEDKTGCWTAFQEATSGKDISIQPLTAEEVDVFWRYLITRIENVKSRSGKVLLATTEGGSVLAEIKNLIRSGKWKTYVEAPPIQETDSEVAVELTAEDRIDCLVDFMECEDKISAAKTYFSLQLEDEAMKVIEDKEWVDYVIAASDEHTFTPSKEEIAIAGKRAALAEAEDIDSPYFEFGNLHWVLDKTDEEYLELFAEFTKQHLDKRGVVRGFCRWAFGITEYSIEDNTLALFEPYWSMIKDHLTLDDVNSSFTTNYDPVQVYCSELDDGVAERIEHPDVLPVLRKLGVDVITRADENESEKLQKDKKESDDKRMARINAPDEEAEVREIRNVLGGRMAKLKEANEPDLKSMADIAHLLWFFYRGAPWSEQYIKDASELGVSPYLWNTMTEDFILMMYAEHMSPEQCGDQWEIYAPQKLLPEIRAMLEQRFKAKSTTGAASVSIEGKRVCVTGKLSRKRSEVEELITKAGGIIASGVSKTTDVLIVGEDAGSKLEKAKELGITILTEEEFALLGDAS